MARTSITDDASTHPLAERLRPEPFRTRDKVAVLGTLAGRMGTNELSCAPLRRVYACCGCATHWYRGG